MGAALTRALFARFPVRMPTVQARPVTQRPDAARVAPWNIPQRELLAVSVTVSSSLDVAKRHDSPVTPSGEPGSSRS